MTGEEVLNAIEALHDIYEDRRGAVFAEYGAMPLEDGARYLALCNGPHNDNNKLLMVVGVYDIDSKRLIMNGNSKHYFNATSIKYVAQYH